MVRARMAKTGERYTAARAELRPEGDAAPPEPVPIPGVVALYKAELQPCGDDTGGLVTENLGADPRGSG